MRQPVDAVNMPIIEQSLGERVATAWASDQFSVVHAPFGGGNFRACEVDNRSWKLVARGRKSATPR